MTGSGRETGPLWDVGTDIGGTFTDIAAVHAGTGDRPLRQAVLAVRSIGGVYGPEAVA